MKHLILIHGRATKPAEAEKVRLAKIALLHGLSRVSQGAADAIESGEVKCTFVYYGDVNNQLMVQANKKALEDLTDRDPAHGNAPCERAGTYDDSMRRLLARRTDDFGKAAYKAFLKKARDARYLDELASFISGAVSVFGLNDDLIKVATPDLSAYTKKRVIGSEIRERLQAPLQATLIAGEDVCLVSHSMGCIVAYDVLWKFSRMSKYKHLRGHTVSRWVTLGCPLGEPGVFNQLYDANEDPDGRFPKGIIGDWLNFSADDDFVSHDGTTENDFAEMTRRKYLHSLADQPTIYTFWEGYDGANPHKFYGYLDNPHVAQCIASWMGVQSTLQVQGK